MLEAGEKMRLESCLEDFIQINNNFIIRIIDIIYPLIDSYYISQIIIAALTKLMLDDEDLICLMLLPGVCDGTV